MSYKAGRHTNRRKAANLLRNLILGLDARLSSLPMGGGMSLFPAALSWALKQRFGTISYKYGLCCQAIPKCACTSLRLWMLRLDGFVREEDPGGHNRMDVIMQRPKYLQLCKKHVRDYRQDYRHFTFVRNPYARLVSHYAYRSGRLEEFGGVSFETFVQNVCSVPDRFRDNHLRSQHRQLHLPRLEFIGRLENFEDDMKKLLDRFDLPKDSLQWIAHKKKAEYGHYRDYYNDATRKLVEKHYAKDLKLFDYSF